MRNLLPSIKFRLRVTPQKTFFCLFFRSFARRLSARKFFFGAKIFVRAKIWEKKIRADAIDSVQKSSKSEPSSRFLSRLKVENSLATFGRMQPIVPRFIALYPPKGKNFRTIGRTRQKVACEILKFWYFLIVCLNDYSILVM